VNGLENPVDCVNCNPVWAFAAIEHYPPPKQPNSDLCLSNCRVSGYSDRSVHPVKLRLTNLPPLKLNSLSGALYEFG